MHVMEGATCVSLENGNNSCGGVVVLMGRDGGAGEEI